MNVLVRPTTSYASINAPSKRDLMDRALDPHILLGMPHLTPAGLSETWLMKELGHRHWLMLARHLGMDDADFRDADGNEVYAAICATSLARADLAAARANDVLHVHSSLGVASRSRALTRHSISVAGIPICQVELISTFVGRQSPGSNRSIARVQMPLPKNAGFAASGLAEALSGLRRQTLDTYLGIPVRGTRLPLRQFSFQPSTTQEFNGADLFYFAHYQALVDRAFEQWDLDTTGIERRDIFFFGNIERRDTLRVNLAGINDAASIAACTIERGDGVEIAKIFVRWHPKPR